jgi:hypothetical protein
MGQKTASPSDCDSTLCPSVRTLQVPEEVAALDEMMKQDDDAVDSKALDAIRLKNGFKRWDHTSGPTVGVTRCCWSCLYCGASLHHTRIRRLCLPSASGSSVRILFSVVVECGTNLSGSNKIAVVHPHAAAV